MPWLPVLGTLGHRPCALGARQRHDYCGGDRSKCSRRGLEFMGVKWPGCPVADLIEDKAVAYIVQLDRHSGAFGLGDRTRYAAWVPDALVAYRRAKDAAASDPRVAQLGGG